MERMVRYFFIKNTFFSDNTANGILKGSAFRKNCLKLMRKAYSGEFEEIIKWALIESENTGSYWRYELDIDWFKDLFVGSGRWLANDGGGQFEPLRELIVRSWHDAVSFLANLNWEQRKPREIEKILITKYSKLYLCAGGSVERLGDIIINNPCEMEIREIVLDQIEKAWEGNQNDEDEEEGLKVEIIEPAELEAC